MDADIFPCWVILRQGDNSRPVAVFWACEFEAGLKFARENGCRMYQGASRAVGGFFEDAKDWAK